MHKWLVKHEWVRDYKGTFSLFLTYLGFIFIPGPLIFAVCEFAFEYIINKKSD